MSGMFDKFLSEITKTLGGGPSSGDIGHFKEGAIAGGKRSLGLDGPDVSLPSSEGFAGLAREVAKNKEDGVGGERNKIDLNALADVAQALEGARAPAGGEINESGPANAALVSDLPKPDQMMTLPNPSGSAQGSTPMSRDLGIIMPAPTTTSIKTGGRATGTKSTLASLQAAVSEPSNDKDQIAEMLKGNAAKYGADRDAANKAAANASNMSDDEKLMTTLLAIVPGLAGLVGGAAAGGGVGALAGLGGGLGGGAAGINSIANDKKEKRKELLAQAEKAGERVNRVDDQSLSHAETLAHEKFTSGQSAADRSFHAGQTDKTLAAHAKEGALGRASAAAIAQAHDASDIDKARVAAGARGSGKPPDDTDVSFYKNTGTAMRAIENINALAKTGAGPTSWLSDPEARSALKQDVGNLAHAYTKIGDPNSAVFLGELENTIETMLANPDTTRTNVFLSKVNRLKQSVAKQAADYSEIRPNVPLHPLVQSYLQDVSRPTQETAPASEDAWARGKPIQR